MNTIDNTNSYTNVNTIDNTNVNPTVGGREIPSITQRLGNTTYEVYVHFSETSKETMTDKVLRLIRNEVISKG
jgi:hypothetical protein